MPYVPGRLLFYSYQADPGHSALGMVTLAGVEIGDGDASIGHGALAHGCRDLSQSLKIYPSAVKILITVIRKAANF